MFIQDDAENIMENETVSELAFRWGRSVFLTGAYSDGQATGTIPTAWSVASWGRKIAQCEEPGRQSQGRWKVATGTWTTDDSSVVTGKSRYTSLRKSRVQYQKPFFLLPWTDV